MATAKSTLINEAVPEMVLPLTLSSDEDESMSSSSSMWPPSISILVIGASSRTGLECIYQLAAHPSKPIVHAFCEDVSSLDVTKLFHPNKKIRAASSIIEGSVRHAVDIEEALDATGANWVVLCGDVSDDIDTTTTNHKGRQKNLRTVSAKNIARVLSYPRFQTVRALVVSRIGAGSTTRLRLGWRGRLDQFKGRVALSDNAGQEEALRPIWNRTTVVRTTTLTDSVTRSGRIVELTHTDRIPTFTTERADLASCIADEICARPTPSGNREINVTSAKL